MLSFSEIKYIWNFGLMNILPIKVELIHLTFVIVLSAIVKTSALMSLMISFIHMYYVQIDGKLFRYKRTQHDDSNNFKSEKFLFLIKKVPRSFDIFLVMNQSFSD